MSKFFIERPILSNVIAIVTILLGAVCLYSLPVAQYPQIVPPTIQVTCSYAGASAEVVASTIGIPIEACGQRGRELDLHAVHQRQRRQLYAHGYLRGRHQSQHFVGFGSKRGKHREAGTAAGSSIPGSQCQKGQHQHPADREPLLRRQPLQRHLPGQLWNHQSAESARAPAGSRANQRVGRGALQHADLARSGQAQGLRADRA